MGFGGFTSDSNSQYSKLGNRRKGFQLTISQTEGGGYFQSKIIKPIQVVSNYGSNTSTTGIVVGSLLNVVAGHTLVLAYLSGDTSGWTAVTESGGAPFQNTGYFNSVSVGGEGVIWFFQNVSAGTHSFTVSSVANTAANWFVLMIELPISGLLESTPTGYWFATSLSTYQQAISYYTNQFIIAVGMNGNPFVGQGFTDSGFTQTNDPVNSDMQTEYGIAPNANGIITYSNGEGQSLNYLGLVIAVFG